MKTKWPYGLNIANYTCVDKPDVPCQMLAQYICTDNELAVRLCPRTCQLCNILSTSVVHTLSVSMVTSPMLSFFSSKTSLPHSITPTTQASVSATHTVTTTQKTSPTTHTTWLPWGQWNCVNRDNSCFQTRYRNCSNANVNDCEGQRYSTVPCVNNTCDVADTCQDVGIACQGNNLEFICPEKSVAWHTCRKSCDLCDTCWDYMDCRSKGTQDYFCINDELATKYCRKSCNKCSSKPVDVTLSKCGNPISDDSKCVELQRALCICSDNDTKSLCTNFCENRCTDYPLTDELRSCTLLGRRRRDIVLTQILTV